MLEATFTITCPPDIKRFKEVLRSALRDIPGIEFTEFAATGTAQLDIDDAQVDALIDELKKIPGFTITYDSANPPRD